MFILIRVLSENKKCTFELSDSSLLKTHIFEANYMLQTDFEAAHWEFDTLWEWQIILTKFRSLVVVRGHTWPKQYKHLCAELYDQSGLVMSLQVETSVILLVRSSTELLRRLQERKSSAWFCVVFSAAVFLVSQSLSRTVKKYYTVLWKTGIPWV